jgi:23S rRNA pseudouridine1911/1915/1917 synthase
MPELYSLHRLTIAAAGEPLFAALANALPGLSRHLARQAVSAGLVTVAGTAVLEPKHALPAGDTAIECDLRHGIKAPLRARLHEATPPAEKPFTIIYEDHALVVVNKAYGVLSAPQQKAGAMDPPERGHVPELLRRAFRKQGRDLRFIGVVHRLDKETSGCLAFALNREAQRLLGVQFATHAAGRTYRCLVTRAPRKDEDTITGTIGRDLEGRRALVDEDEPGKESITHFRVLHRFRLGAELEVRLETGRTHQIRVSLAAIGCPVYGDRVYGLRVRPIPGAPALPKAPRLMLHAHLLALDHPLSGQRIEAVAPIPPAFAEFAKLLR